MYFPSSNKAALKDELLSFQRIRLFCYYLKSTPHYAHWRNSGKVYEEVLRHLDESRWPAHEFFGLQRDLSIFPAWKELQSDMSEKIRSIDGGQTRKAMEFSSWELSELIETRFPGDTWESLSIVASGYNGPHQTPVGMGNNPEHHRDSKRNYGKFVKSTVYCIVALALDGYCRKNGIRLEGCFADPSLIDVFGNLSVAPEKSSAGLGRASLSEVLLGERPSRVFYEHLSLNREVPHAQNAHRVYLNALMEIRKTPWTVGELERFRREFGARVRWRQLQEQMNYRMRRVGPIKTSSTLGLFMRIEEEFPHCGWEYTLANNYRAKIYDSGERDSRFERFAKAQIYCLIAEAFDQHCREKGYAHIRPLVEAPLPNPSPSPVLQ